MQRSTGRWRHVHDDRERSGAEQHRRRSPTYGDTDGDAGDHLHLPRCCRNLFSGVATCRPGRTRGRHTVAVRSRSDQPDGGQRRRTRATASVGDPHLDGQLEQRDRVHDPAEPPTPPSRPGSTRPTSRPTPRPSRRPDWPGTPSTGTGSARTTESAPQRLGERDAVPDQDESVGGAPSTGCSGLRARAAGRRLPRRHPHALADAASSRQGSAPAAGLRSGSPQPPSWSSPRRGRQPPHSLVATYSAQEVDIHADRSHRRKRQGRRVGRARPA